MPGAGAPEKVMVVDDSRTIREVMSLYLRQLGCEPVPLDSGLHSVETAAEQQPLVVFLDFQMEGKRGDDVCRELKTDARTAQIPVVMLTGSSAPHEIMYTWRAGADDFLPKPIKQPQVLAKIEALRGATRYSPGAPQPKNGTGRLLFIDDSRFYRQLLGDALEHSGFELIYAREGGEALDALATQAQPIDCVLCDVAMPGMDGFTFVKALREDPRHARVKVMMCSGIPPTPDVLAKVEQLTGGPLIEKRQVTVEQIVAMVLDLTRPAQKSLRAERRAPFFSVVEFRPAGTDMWSSGFSYNISQGGIFVRTLTGAPPGADLEMRFNLGVILEVEGRGQVAWSNPYRHRTSFSCPIGMGVRFTQLPPNVTKELERLLASASVIK